MCFDFEQRVHDAFACMGVPSAELNEESMDRIDFIDLGTGVSIPGMEDFRLEKMPTPEHIEPGTYTSQEADMTIEVTGQEPNGDVLFHWGELQSPETMNLKFFKQLFVRQC